MTAPRGTAALALPAIPSAAGEIELPGSKSISNRTLLLAALARGRLDRGALLAADDIDRMREALAELGVVVAPLAAPRAFRVEGAAGRSRCAARGCSSAMQAPPFAR